MNQPRNSGSTQKINVKRKKIVQDNSEDDEKPFDRTPPNSEWIGSRQMATIFNREDINGYIHSYDNDMDGGSCLKGDPSEIQKALELEISTAIDDQVHHQFMEQILRQARS